MGGTSRLSAKEKKLLASITDDEEPLTYAALVREKQDVSRGISRGDGPYGDVNKATLQRLEGALIEDQLAAAEALGGIEARKTLEAANGLVYDRKRLEEKIVSAFGSEIDGSVASNLTNALRQGGKGDVTSLNRVMSVIPEDLRGKAVSAALTELSRAKTGPNGGFSFAEFAKIYRGLRNQPPIYAQIAKAIGPDGNQILNDLYKVSNAVAKAQAAIEKTGKANQITQSGALAAEGLVTRILQTGTGKAAVRAATTVGGGATGGMAGAVAGDAIGLALASGKKDRISAAGKVLASDEFKRLAIEAATKPTVSEKTKRAVLFSQSFRKFAKSAGIENPEAWLNAAILGSVASQEGQQ
jgi:hypothetical protein